MDEESESFGLPLYGLISGSRLSMPQRITAFVERHVLIITSVLCLCLIVQNQILLKTTENCGKVERPTDFDQKMLENMHPAVITCEKPDCAPTLNVSSILSYIGCLDCFVGLRVHRVFRDKSSIAIDFDFTDYLHLVLWSEFDWKIYGDVKFPFVGAFTILLTDDAPHAILRWSGLKVVLG